MELDFYSVILFIVVGLIFGVVRTINSRMKPKKYERPPEFSWDELDGGEDSPSGKPGKGGK